MNGEKSSECTKVNQVPHYRIIPNTFMRLDTSTPWSLYAAIQSNQEIEWGSLRSWETGCPGRG